MNLSPLQLDLPEYPVVSVRAVPSIEGEARDGALPIEVRARVLYEHSGDHFAYLSIEQNDESYPYLLKIDVFTTFKIDVAGCREAYKSSFNPAVVSVNVARLLFSGARELIAMVSSRAPYGSAKIPNLTIQPHDVDIGFEDEKMDEILTKVFGIDPQVIRAARAEVDKRNLELKGDDSSVRKGVRVGRAKVKKKS